MGCSASARQVVIDAYRDSLYEDENASSERITACGWAEIYWLAGGIVRNVQTVETVSACLAQEPVDGVLV